ncbi:hypothetical protein BCR41DRAFT_161749 [Lobosporangium transversale]|uniref:Uncharacterized protein n=1 Tax=Lobosporangium transversale TaxID=64571 RepID=A0A1Y2GCU4_9FUNG|nr:hypothetical protein BCR41DRAFT_161749 [Lobosporangium transversale]ORZ07252.1 hypothetical protein BCR41DRAFT_161749 [Lobosporangium transversale]|eukprot:XP_021877915.1 hypothetical protein BCR41DRAFT_161749 [Lobosporangium transversale]
MRIAETATMVMPRATFETWLTRPLFPGGAYTGSVTWVAGAPAINALGDVTLAEAGTTVMGSL